MDAGWVYTVDENYEKGVSKILNNVYQKLKDDKYTFTIGDIYYFKRWYEIQNEDTKQRLKLYV